MAIAAGTVWEARITGPASNAGGGGFVPGLASPGTDFSQQDTVQYALTGVTTAAADAILLHASAAADMKDNILNITGGTNFTVGRYQVLSVVVGVSITLDRVCTTAAGAAGVVNIGGALSLGSADDAVFEAMEAGNKMHIKSGAYTLGGAVNVIKDGTYASPINIEGYNTSRGDNPSFANCPSIACAANTFIFAGDFYNFKNLVITTTAVAGFDIGTGAILENIKCTNSSASASRVAISGGIGARLIKVEAVSTNGDAVACSDQMLLKGGYFHDSVTGIDFGNGDGCKAITCIIDTCTTGLSGSASPLGATIDGCSFYNGTTAISMTHAGAVYYTIMNNIFHTFTNGINSTNLIPSDYGDYNKFFSVTNPYVNFTAGANDSTATDPGFVDAPNGNFAIGTALKATGFPGAFPGGLSTGYLDPGAVQRQEPVPTPIVPIRGTGLTSY